MKILIACEESQNVCNAFRKNGHEAYSCDIQPCSGGNPEWHLQQDVIPLLEQHWDMIIAFPPCTHLCISGARWFDAKRKDGRQKSGIDFFMRFANCKCERVAIENPIGIMSHIWRKPDQIIQPYMFGDAERKSTCLWLKGLPLLKPTNIVEPVFSKSGLTKTCIGYGKKNNAIMRSKTFPGIANAMAQQWNELNP
jgi:hypothetical protein